MPPEPLVFIVDDDLSFRRSLERLVRSVGLRGETFASAAEFLRRRPHDGPCCLVLDVRMPGMSGLDLQTVLATAEHPIPIIFITAHGDIAMSVRAMKGGALDFFPKPVQDLDLLEAIQQALAKDEHARAQRAITQGIRQRVRSLTPRQREVLSLVVTGLLNKQIAAVLGVSERTVKMHRSHIMEKMQVHSVAQLVSLAERVGLSPSEPRPPQVYRPHARAETLGALP
jgi:FixJ family two-component response regulator